MCSTLTASSPSPSPWSPSPLPYSPYFLISPGASCCASWRWDVTGTRPWEQESGSNEATHQHRHFHLFEGICICNERLINKVVTTFGYFLRVEMLKGGLCYSIQICKNFYFLLYMITPSFDEIFVMLLQFMYWPVHGPSTAPPPTKKFLFFQCHL